MAWILSLALLLGACTTPSFAGLDDGAGLGGPSVEVGVGQVLCLSALVSRDLRFNDRDDTFVGVNLSLCGLVEQRRW